MVFAFGLFFPGALASSLGWRSPALAPGRWFVIHGAMTVVGVLLALIGFIIALAMTPAGSHFNHGHEVVGLIIILVALTQPIFIVVSRGIPTAEKEGTTIPRQRVWDITQKVCSVVLLVGGIYQVISGYARTQDLVFYGYGQDGLTPESKRPDPPSMESTIVLYFVLLVLVLVALGWGLKRSYGRGIKLRRGGKGWGSEARAEGSLSKLGRSSTSVPVPAVPRPAASSEHV
eukprot:scaffold734_cov35-Tisochrysis_lutea.AAC.2